MSETANLEIRREQNRRNSLAFYHRNKERLCAERRERSKEPEWKRGHAASVREANRKNPVANMLRKARARAKARGMDLTITKADIVIPDFCPVLGIKLEVGEGRHHASSPTLDRIDNDLGYVKGNVLVVSYRANRIKNDSTPDELMRVALFYGVSGNI